MRPRVTTLVEGPDVVECSLYSGIYARDGQVDAVISTFLQRGNEEQYFSEGQAGWPALRMPSFFLFASRE